MADEQIGELAKARWGRYLVHGAADESIIVFSIDKKPAEELQSFLDCQGDESHHIPSIMLLFATQKVCNA